ncbi:hypothetical protein P8X24_04895 [Pyrococcus kukulkanii]|uniref:hypothetical protein n=1 Tax=Pyrococcus kukulkanii TaxID=1609559 RepID=UPI0035661805
MKKEKYLGWDPYDGLSGKISGKFANKRILNIAVIQLNLYSPLNLRPFFGIQKGCANKALALFSRGYLYLYAITDREEFKIEAKTLLKALESQNISNSINKFSCASYYFPYIAPKHYLSHSLPDIICVTESLKSFLVAYEILGKKKYFILARKGMRFLLDELLEKSNDTAYFKYTPEEKGKIVFNVSALALETISSFLKYSPDYTLIDIGEEAIKLLINHQRDDGAWPYSLYADSGVYYWQIDYHQGFIIDGLVSFLPYITEENLRNRTLEAIEKGVDFYMNRQFSPEGWSYYRYPIKYPIDIHNQAQGIITFSKLYKAFKNPKYLEFAEKIAGWTIKNMQDPAGYFYAHRWLGFVNKIPYMRWAQAWMMLALATLISMGGQGNESSHGWAH